MPRELEFKFQPSARQDDKAIADAEDVRIRNGSLTLNEARSKNGLPLLDSDYADQPIFVATGAYGLTDAGPVAFGGTPDAGILDANSMDSSTSEPALNEASAEAPKSTLPADIAELVRFKKWLKKSPKDSFHFDYVPEGYADTLNKFVAVGDFDGARWYAERYSL
ncbi:MAG: hypothetical protein CGW95_09240 [Phenylobacterium zucineum]|nr:MAG: hypothetical protein CGW95_09240 [Phenylobacterium zucineum]